MLPPGSEPRNLLSTFRGVRSCLELLGKFPFIFSFVFLVSLFLSPNQLLLLCRAPLSAKPSGPSMTSHTTRPPSPSPPEDVRVPSPPRDDSPPRPTNVSPRQDEPIAPPPPPFFPGLTPRRPPRRLLSPPFHPLLPMIPLRRITRLTLMSP